MKRTFLLICTILCANVLMAQRELATLKHNESISIYYGPNAFISAYNAAVNGDVITLSDGSFNSPTGFMSKGITVRGNGACADTSRNSAGTYFYDQFYVSCYGDLQFSAEGIRFIQFKTNGSNCNVKLKKCHVVLAAGGFGGLQAENCVIYGSGRNLCGNQYSHSNTYNNCILKGSYTPSYSTCSNCIMIGEDGGDNSQYYQYTNCIVIKDGTSNDVVLSSSVNNSILIGFTTSSNLFSSGNVAMSISDVFENWNGNTITTDLEAYVLKSSVSDTIVGFDGSEVGIFGGFMPFEKWTPTYSVIKRCNVSNRTTADGKLSVDIEVVTE